MEKLLENMFDITVAMMDSLKRNDFEEFEQLLESRNALMIQVDEHKAAVQDFCYSLKSKQLLNDTFQLNQHMAPLIEGNLLETQNVLKQIKNNKQISKKYHQFHNQGNGIFVDAKK